MIAVFSLAILGCASTSTTDVVRLEPPAPELAGLTDLGGKPFDLARLVREHEATVLVWFATQCPCVRRYQPRMEALRDAYRADRVALLAVASNADDDYETLKEAVAERELALPLAVDPGGRLATLLGVQSTPTVVLLDREGQVRFLGWIDNEREPGESGRVAYLEAAVDAVLEPGAGDAPSRSPVYGCRITRSLSEPSHCPKAPRPTCSHHGH